MTPISTTDVRAAAGGEPIASGLTRIGLGIPQQSGGLSLLELLVALACTALLAAASLPLVLGAKTATRRRAAVLDARSLAERVVTQIAYDLRAVGTSLEGGGSLSIEGLTVPLLEEAVDGELRMVRTVGAALEVEAAGATGLYRATTGQGILPGSRVAAVGSPGRPYSAGFPVGTVVGIRPLAAGVEIEVRWGAYESTLLGLWGVPRALVPVRERAYHAVATTDGFEIRRRDAGGNWQPVGGGLAGLAVSWVLADATAAPVPVYPASDNRCVSMIIVAAEASAGAERRVRATAHAAPRAACR